MLLVPACLKSCLDVESSDMHYCPCYTAADELPFVPTVVGVFTWFAVGRYEYASDLLNTFQAVLASSPREAWADVMCFGI